MSNTKQLGLWDYGKRDRCILHNEINNCEYLWAKRHPNLYFKFPPKAHTVKGWSPVRCRAVVAVVRGQGNLGIFSSHWKCDPKDLAKTLVFLLLSFIILLYLFHALAVLYPLPGHQNMPKAHMYTSGQTTHAHIIKFKS